MVAVYSEVLLRGNVTMGTPLTYTVPTGFRAVVRDIVFHNAGTLGQGLQGIECYDSLNQIIACVFDPLAIVGNDYHWTGHQIVDEGEEIFVAALDNNWRVRISGYRLKLP